MNIDDVAQGAERIAGQVAVTPLGHSVTLSAMTGADVVLKFENLQFTSSFKERGALNCLLCLDEAERAVA
jgi:threonine dehydratase